MTCTDCGRVDKVSQAMRHPENVDHECSLNVGAHIAIDLRIDYICHRDGGPHGKGYSKGPTLTAVNWHSMA